MCYSTLMSCCGPFISRRGFPKNGLPSWWTVAIRYFLAPPASALASSRSIRPPSGGAGLADAGPATDRRYAIGGLFRIGRVHRLTHWLTLSSLPGPGESHERKKTSSRGRPRPAATFRFDRGPRPAAGDRLRACRTGCGPRRVEARPAAAGGAGAAGG